MTDLYNYEKRVNATHRAYVRDLAMFYACPEELRRLRERIEKLERALGYVYPLDRTHGVSRCASP